MKKLILLLFFLPLVSFGQFFNNKNSPTTPNESISVDSENQSTEEITFRKMNWGDSVEDLKKTYPKVQFEEEYQDGADMLMQEGRLIGIDVQIVYIFSENKLVAGFYYIDPMALVKGSRDRLKDFNTLSIRLNEKYTMEREDEWLDTTWKDDPNYLDHAVSMGDVSLVERAEVGDTFIAHTLEKEGLSLNHVIIYASGKWVGIMQKEQSDDF